MTMPEAAPIPAPSRPPTIAQVPQRRGCCKYAQPLTADASSAAPPTPATALINLDFSLMSSSSPNGVYTRSEPHPLTPASLEPVETGTSPPNGRGNIVIFVTRMQHI